jgi:hypothetical protein
LFLLRGVDGGLNSAQQRIDQGIVQFERLVHNEGDEVQETVFVGAA